jgi:hypothetical protein
MCFADRPMAAIAATERGQHLCTDDTIPGFGSHVGAVSKAFVLAIGEDRRRIMIGQYPIVSLAQAREKAKRILAERQLGVGVGPPRSLAMHGSNPMSAAAQG